MEDFTGYVANVIEPSEASFVGAAKITPPPEWKPASADYLDKSASIILRKPPKQKFEPGPAGGVYFWTRENYSNLSVSSFAKLAFSVEYRPPRHNSYRELEQIYWETLGDANPIYGSDIPRSLFDDTCKSFNLKNLDTILQKRMSEAQLNIDGINNSYLYFGMWQSTFPWHTEDHELYSINYLHYGSPKSWYVIPPSCGRKFEDLVRKYFPEEMFECKGFLRHKTLVISPSVLLANNVLYANVTQEEGDFILTLPYAYHSGFNHGFNIAEATNFATDRWINFGLFSSLSECLCKKDAVRMNIYSLFFKNSREGRKRSKSETIRHPITHEELTIGDLKKKFKKS